MSSAPGFKKYPGHQISTRPSDARVRVMFKGEVIADMRSSYEKPYDEMSAIREYVAFYPDKVDSISAG